MRKSHWLHLLKISCCLIIAVCLLAPAALAQRFDGTLRGTITDASGAVIPDAKVTAKNKGTGAVSTAVTSSAGSYSIPNLLIGMYTVKVEASGFNTHTREDVEVRAAQTVEVSAAMAVAGVSTTVEVQTGADVLQTESSELISTFGARQATDLPTMFGANGFGSVQNLAIFLPNTTSQIAGTNGNGGSVGGLRGRQNNFSIDGATNTDQQVSISSLEVIQDAVAEFTVSTNQFSAEYGSAAGGQFNVVTRTGTNDIHGAAWWYNSNRKYNASGSQEQALIASGAQSGKSRFDYNRLGGRLGGAIVKDKLFIFGAYEHQATGLQPSAPEELMPTAAGMSTLRTLAANDIIRGFLSQWPTAPTAEQTIPVTRGGVTSQIPVGTVIAVAPSFLDEHNYIINADWNQGNHQLRFRHIKDRIRQPLTGSFPQAQFNSASGSDNRRVVVNDIWNLTPRMVNDFKATFGRLESTSTLSGVGADYPTLFINDLGAAVGPASNLPQFRFTNWYQLANGISYGIGNHTLKAGFEYRWTTSPSEFLSNKRGQYGYQTVNALINDQVPDLAGFSFQGIGDGSFAGNAKNVSWYIQDDFKLTPRLTVNLGLRYEFFGLPRDAKANARNAISDCPECKLIFHVPKTDLNNFAPRVGFAWDPYGNGKWAIRGGAGMGYDGLPYNFYTNGAPPQKQAVLTPASACAGTFSAPAAWCTSRTNFLASGAMKQTFIPPSTTAAARAVTANIMTDNISPKVFNWSLAVQRELMKDTVIEVRYLGTRALSLPVQVQRNAISTFRLGGQPLPTYLSNSTIPATVSATAPTRAQFAAAQNFRFAAQGFLNVITDFPPIASSHYHGASIDLNRRMSKGLQMRINYTLSRAMDNATTDLFTSRVNPRRAEDHDNMRNEWGRSTVDVHNKLALTWIYDVPKVAGRGAFLKHLTSGWEWTGSYLYQGGQPITVQSGVDSNGNFDAAGDRAILNPSGAPRTGTAVTRVCRDATSGATSVLASCPDARTVGYVANNPNARYVQAQLGALTNVGRNTETSEPTDVWNMSFVRSVSFREKVKISFRADMYNIFNQKNYVLAPASIFGVTANALSTSYAALTTTNFLKDTQFDSGSRAIQFGLKVVF